MSVRNIFVKGSPPAPSKVERRIKSLPTGAIVSWAEQSLYVIGRSLSEARKSEDLRGRGVFYDEAVYEAELLVSLLQEVRAREG